MDCNAPCNGCGCGGGGICSGGALGHQLRLRPRRLQQPQGRLRELPLRPVQPAGRPASARSSAGWSPASPRGRSTAPARPPPATTPPPPTHDRPCLHGRSATSNTAVEDQPSTAVPPSGHRLGASTSTPTPRSTSASTSTATRHHGHSPTGARSDVAIANPGQGPEPRVRRHRPDHLGRPQRLRVWLNAGPVGNGNPASAAATVTRSERRSATSRASTVGTGRSPSGAGPLDPDTTGPVSVHVYVDGNWARPGRRRPAPPRRRPGLPRPRPEPRLHRHRAPRGRRPQRVRLRHQRGQRIGQHPDRLRHGHRGNPFGSLDVATATAGGVDVSGWAIDPDQLTSPIDVQLRLDGNPVSTVAAGESRPDVGSVYPTAGANHGFSRSSPPQPVCTRSRRWRSTSGPAPTRCSPPAASRCARGSPFGNLERTWTGPDTVRVPGWVLDPDNTGPIQVQVDVDGVVATTATADVSRPRRGRRVPGLRPRARLPGRRAGHQRPAPRAGRGPQRGRRLAGGARRAAAAGGRQPVRQLRGRRGRLRPGRRRRLGHRPRHLRSHRRPRVHRRQAGPRRHRQPVPSRRGRGLPAVRPEPRLQHLDPDRPRPPRGLRFAIDQGPGTENVLIGCRTVTA